MKYLLRQVTPSELMLNPGLQLQVSVVVLGFLVHTCVQLLGELQLNPGATVHTVRHKNLCIACIITSHIIKLMHCQVIYICLLEFTCTGDVIRHQNKSFIARAERRSYSVIAHLVAPADHLTLINVCM